MRQQIRTTNARELFTQTRGLLVKFVQLCLFAAAFVRHAPERQKHALWERVGEAVERRLGPKPVWVSTAGAGVSWLHVRLDDRPKYYGYAPYRDGS